MLREDVLLTSTPYPEEAERVDSKKWAFHRFDLQVGLEALGTDFSENDASDGALRRPWPSAPGFYSAPNSPGGILTMPWEMHGARLGYQDTTVRAYKERSDHSLSLTSDVTRFAMSPNSSIIVPIQVVLVRPSYKTDYPIDTFMLQYRQEFQGVLWDDLWTGTSVRSSVPGGLLQTAQREWTHRTKPSWTQPEYSKEIPFPWSGIANDTITASFSDVTNGDGTSFYAPFTRPDDIWIQCGIQFRLIKMVELQLPQEYVELKTGPGPSGLICDRTSVALKFYEIVLKAGKSPYSLRSDLPVIVFNWTVQPLACDLPSKRIDLACDGGLACTSGGWVGVGIQNISSLFADQAKLALAHELGHIVSLLDINCSAPGEEPSLMCSFLAAGSPLVKQSTCAAARTRAETLRKRYIGY